MWKIEAMSAIFLAGLFCKVSTWCVVGIARRLLREGSRPSSPGTLHQCAGVDAIKS